MKTKKIADISKKTMRITLEDVQEGEISVQWVGDGTGMYRLDNAPYLSEQTIFTVFDIDWKKRADFIFHHNDMEEFCELCGDTEEKEIYLLRGSTEIYYMGTVLVALYSDSGILLLNRKYLKPLDDLEEVRYFRRVDLLGREYVVAKDGMLAIAVIYPTHIGKGQNILAKELKNLAHFIYEQWEKVEGS